MRADITKGLIPLFGDPSATVVSTSSPHVATLASLSYYLVGGKIPASMEKEIEIAFFAVKEDSRNFPQTTWQEFFEVWRKRLRADDQLRKSVETRDSALTTIRGVVGEIDKDLDSEN
jgi:hypothetical protein